MIPNFSDHASNERTFLAWVRTVLAIIGFGLAITKLDGQTNSVWSTLSLLSTGAVVVILAYLRMRALRKRIDARDNNPDDSGMADALLLALLLALFALLGVFALHVI